MRSPPPLFPPLFAWGAGGAFWSVPFLRSITGPSLFYALLLVRPFFTLCYWSVPFLRSITGPSLFSLFGIKLSFSVKERQFSKKNKKLSLGLQVGVLEDGLKGRWPRPSPRGVGPGGPRRFTFRGGVYWGASGRAGAPWCRIGKTAFYREASRRKKNEECQAKM